MREALITLSTGIQITIKDLLDSITEENFDTIYTEIEKYCDYDGYISEQLLEELDRIKKKDIRKFKEEDCYILTIFQKPMIEEDILHMNHYFQLFSYDEDTLSKIHFKERFNYANSLNLKNFIVKLCLTMRLDE